MPSSSGVHNNAAKQSFFELEWVNDRNYEEFAFWIFDYCHIEL